MQKVTPYQRKKYIIFLGCEDENEAASKTAEKCTFLGL